MSTEFTNCGCGCPEGAQLVTIEENEDRSYLYDVGGEQKETVPFTKELRQWQQSFINIGGRALNTLADIRSLTKHIAGQVMICFENNGVYQYQNIIIDDDGETILMPDNVFVENAGRWVLRVKLDTTSFNLWSTLKYGTALSEDQTIYVDYINGIDSDNEDGTINNPFKTVQYAIDTYVVAHGYWKGALTIKLKEDYTPALSIVGLIGNGSLVIESDSATVRNVSSGTVFNAKNNQVKISLINIESESTVIDSCNITFVNCITTGTAINSELRVGYGSVFEVNASYCDMKIYDSIINGTISMSNFIATGIRATSSVSISNSIVASDDYQYIVLGNNCTHNKKEPEVLTHTISLDADKAVVSGLITTPEFILTERGVCFKQGDTPTINDDKVTVSSSNLSITATSSQSYTDCIIHARCYVKSDNIVYYGNKLTIPVGNP